MKPLKDQVAELRKAGYGLAAAQMKAAHDVLLLAMHRCGFKKSSTVKGGVVMSHISKDIRRTTMGDKVSVRRFRSYVDLLVYRNRNCRVKDKPDVLAALETTFASRLYLKRLNDARVNWLQLDPETVTAEVLAFLKAKL